MPADTSIAYQAPVENSGRARGPPSRILPYRLKAKYSATNRKMLKSMMYSHPSFSLMNERTSPKTVLAESWNIRVRPMKTAMNPADQNVTVGWMSKPHLTMFLSPGSRSATSG